MKFSFVSYRQNVFLRLENWRRRRRRSLSPEPAACSSAVARTVAARASCFVSTSSRALAQGREIRWNACSWSAQGGCGHAARGAPLEIGDAGFRYGLQKSFAGQRLRQDL